MGIVSTDGMPTSGEPRGGEELDIITKLGEIFAEFNGNIDLENLSSALKSQFNLTSRGKCIVDDEQSRSNTSYGKLTTPDEVTNVVVPDGALVCLTYSALVKESSNAAASIAVFIGSNQLKWIDPIQATPQVQEAQIEHADGANNYSFLSSGPFGLMCDFAYTAPSTADQVPHTGVVSTGFALNAMYRYTNGSDVYVQQNGGILVIEGLAAGTYDISVQFKASTGSVTAKLRKLRVWVEGF